MNNDLISREALKKDIDNLRLFKPWVREEIKTHIDNAPAVNIPNYGGQVVPDVLQGWKYEERPQGEWIIHKDYNESCRYGCNQCGNLTNVNSRFCPNCGVKMSIDKLQHKCHTLSRNKTTCDVCGAKLE